MLSAAPVVTDSMREWAAAFVNSCRQLAGFRSEPFDAEKAQAAIREALLSPRRYDPRDDIDEPAGLPGRSRDDDQQADREAGYHYPRHLSGDLR